MCKGLRKREKKVGKILESLPNTVIAGIVLTVIVVLLVPVIAG